MKKAIMIFPDNVALSEFLAGRELSFAEAESQHHSLIAPLSTEEVRIACNNFRAVQISLQRYEKSFK